MSECTCHNTTGQPCEAHGPQIVPDTTPFITEEASRRIQESAGLVAEVEGLRGLVGELAGALASVLNISDYDEATTAVDIRRKARAALAKVTEELR